MLARIEDADKNFTYETITDGIEFMKLVSFSKIPTKASFEVREKCICLLFNLGNRTDFYVKNSKLTLEKRYCNIYNFSSNQDKVIAEFKNDFHMISIFFKLTAFKSLLKYFDNETFLEDFDKNGTIRLFDSNLYVDNEIVYNLNQLEKENVQFKLPQSTVIGRLLIILSKKILQNTHKKGSLHKKNGTWGKVEMDKIYEVERIIRTDFSTPYTIADLAKICGTNECYLKRNFKNIFDMPIYTYKRKVQMGLAFQLLVTTNKRIVHISKEVGFKHTTHFITAFRKYYKSTPNQLRNQYQAPSA